MYDFLLRGDKRQDIRLQSEDVIFIPPIGPMVAIGTPKTDKEIGAALKTLARLQLQNEDPQQGYSQGTRAPEVSWKKQEDLRIMGL
jgi:hypothetical protein